MLMSLLFISEREKPIQEDSRVRDRQTSELHKTLSVLILGFFRVAGFD